MSQQFNALHPRIGNGTFTEKEYNEAPGVRLGDGSNLTQEAVRLAADTYLGNKLELAAVNELGDEQRRADKQGYVLPTTSPLTERVASWGILGNHARKELLSDAKLGQYAYLLDEDPLSAGGRVTVDHSVLAETDTEGLGRAIDAIHRISETQAKGEIKLESVDKDFTNFTIDHEEVTLELRMRDGRGLIVTADPGKYDESGWMERASIITTGSDSPGSLDREINKAHAQAILSQELNASPYKDHQPLFGEVDAQNRTAEIFYEGGEYILDVDQETIEVGGTKVHSSMVSGFMNHVAAGTTGGTGKEFMDDLSTVFRKARVRTAVINAQ